MQQELKWDSFYVKKEVIDFSTKNNIKVVAIIRAALTSGYEIFYYDESPQPDYRTHLSNLIKIIGSLGAEHGHSLNPGFKKQLEDAKKLIQ